MSMLVLTRRIGESIMIGNDVQVTVLGAKGGQVRLGVQAPKHTRVDREEIRAPSMRRPPAGAAA